MFPNVKRAKKSPLLRRNGLSSKYGECSWGSNMLESLYQNTLLNRVFTGKNLPFCLLLVTFKQYFPNTDSLNSLKIKQRIYNPYSSKVKSLTKEISLLLSFKVRVIKFLAVSPTLQRGV